MGVEGKNVSELELQDLVTRHGVRSGRGRFWVDDLVSRLASRRMVVSLMRLCEKGVVEERCAWAILTRGARGL